MILNFPKKSPQRITLKSTVFFLILLIFSTNLFAETPGKFTVSGYVKDASNGEMLLGVTVRVAGTATGTTTNQFGFYSLSLSSGKYSLVYSFVGYRADTLNIDLRNNVKKDVELSSSSENLEEVEITAKRNNENIRTPEMSMVKVGIKQILPMY